jgi:hypothetical protein
MKKIARFLSVGLALALLLPAYPSRAQVQATERVTLFAAFDLDGEAADADQVLTAAVGIMADATDYTAGIAAQPDSCRLIDITVADAANITAGTLTVVGTDCLGYDRTCSWSFTGAVDTGVQSLTCTDGEGAYFANITSITTGALTGETGAETITVGYTTAPAVGWPLYGVRQTQGAMNEQGVDVFGSYPIELPITTSGSASTTVTAVSNNLAFTTVSVGDLLLLQLADQRGALQQYERKVTAKASANSITVNAAINIPAAGVTFRFKKLFFSTNPADRMWVPVKAITQATYTYRVDANANTGGVTYLVECAPVGEGPAWPTRTWVQVWTGNTASGATLAPSLFAADLGHTGTPFEYCRFGVWFGTGDDADAAAEDISLNLVVAR